METFTYADGKFLLNGKPFTVISGAIHYFRVHPDYWEDRLKKLKACGFNTVETYACWNLHERKEGQFDFSGMLDIERFITIAEDLGLYVIVRPGPYICAEWEFGGLPSWLLSYQGVDVRCNDRKYLEKVKPYYKNLLSIIKPHLITNGGKIIMVQIENEYGSYGDDKEYLKEVVKIYKDNGVDCTLFTSDGPEYAMLGGGSLPEFLSVANFGSNPKEKLPILTEFQKDRPLMCGEFWCGWFDHWYEKGINPRTKEDIEKSLNEFFDLGASFNFYMFHGGTNFGFYNGANCDGDHYQPTVTSYDYRAPLNESGDMTDLYYTIKDIIEKRTGAKAPDIKVENSKKKAYGRVSLDKTAPLFDNVENLSSPVYTAAPKCMEDLGQDFGYILYRTTLKGPLEKLELDLGIVHDRAQVFLDGKYLGKVERSQTKDSMFIELGFNQSARLDILVENMGRINYGKKLFDKKGLLGGVSLGQRYHFGWETYSLTMDDLTTLNFDGEKPNNAPTFYCGELLIDQKPCDTYIRLDGFTKGFVTINGFNIGRYYTPAGPQKTLYVPAPILKTGKNQIIVFDSDGAKEPIIEFTDKHEVFMN